MRLFLLFLALAAALPAQQTVRVLSYNIHHGEGTDGRIDLPRIAAVIGSVSPDLVALQEVDVRTARSNGVDQLLELARLTGMQPVYGRTIAHQGGLYGNAVLARVPVNGFVNHPLPGREPRGVVEALVSPQPGSQLSSFRFLATHLDLVEAERVAAVARIEEIAAAHLQTMPVILAGDLNAVVGSLPISQLLENWALAQGGGPMPTSPAASPRSQIDFILVRPAARWRVAEARVLNEPVASDHRPIFSVLELLPEPAAVESPRKSPIRLH